MVVKVAVVTGGLLWEYNCWSRNTGGGGGGGNGNPSVSYTGGTGGKGIVIVRYQILQPAAPGVQQRFFGSKTISLYLHHLAHSLSWSKWITQCLLCRCWWWWRMVVVLLVVVAGGLQYDADTSPTQSYSIVAGVVGGISPAGVNGPYQQELSFQSSSAFGIDRRWRWWWWCLLTIT